MDEERKDGAPAPGPEADLDARDEKGRRVYNENGEKIHWSSTRDRVVALVLALIVIAITIAMAYSIAVGDFFRH